MKIDFYGLGGSLIDGLLVTVQTMMAEYEVEGFLPHHSSRQLWLKNASEVMSYYSGVSFPNCPLTDPVKHLARGLFSLACNDGGVDFHGHHLEIRQYVEIVRTTTSEDAANAKQIADAALLVLEAKG